MHKPTTYCDENNDNSKWPPNDLNAKSIKKQEAIKLSSESTKSSIRNAKPEQSRDRTKSPAREGSDDGDKVHTSHHH
jgi:hypothetical protein